MAVQAYCCDQTRPSSPLFPFNLPDQMTQKQNPSFAGRVMKLERQTHRLSLLLMHSASLSKSTDGGERKSSRRHQSGNQVTSQHHYRNPDREHFSRKAPGDAINNRYHRFACTHVSRTHFLSILSPRKSLCAENQFICTPLQSVHTCILDSGRDE